MNRLFRSLVLCLLSLIAASTTPRAISPDVVVSQVYGGGGNSGAPFTNDFIELYNRGSVAVNLTGWTVQYASAAGTTWSTTALSGTIQPGKYFLVQEIAGLNAAAPLPTPDATGVINLAAAAGKVALVRTATALSGACPSSASFADLIGYGTTATCSETNPTANLSNSTAAIRLQGGATDSDNNAADFAIDAPSPRNSSLLPTAPAANVVISQVYGGGGNVGANLKNDFIELRNREPFEVSVAGWTIQYASSSGSTWQATPLSGTIPAGGYYLVQEAMGAGGSVSLPTPDAIGAISMSAVSGKVALVPNASLLTGSCPATGLLDFVGYGAANCFEGSGAAPALSAETAAIRLDGGLVDTNDNVADFSEGTPSPKSTLGVPPTGIGAAAPASIPAGTSTLLTLKVMPGAFPPSPLTAVTVDLSSIGGGTQALFDDGTNGDAVAGDNIYSFQVVATGDPGFKTLTGSITDARGRVGTPAIRLAIETSTTTAISQIQGSGSISPMTGQFVTTTGIVTALRSSGFYVQTRDGLEDSDPTTSEGLFVFTAGATVKPAVGDEVNVAGVVSEFAPAPPSPPVTELSAGPLFRVIDSLQPLPVPVTLQPSDTSPAGPLEQLEKYEGMRVRADLQVVAPTGGTVIESTATSSSNGVFYAVVDGVPRPVREPGLDPASPAPAGLPCCVPRFDGNPERLRIDSSAQPGSAILNVAAGQRISGITGVLDFAFGSYSILPDPGAGPVTGEQGATSVPVPSATEFTVASANLERFFDEQDDPDHDDAVLTTDAVNLRLQKASLSVRHVLRTPDVLGVVEVENLTILQRLAAKINADAVAEGESDPMYVAYLEEGNDIGGIDSGFLVKSSRVDVVGIEQVGKDATYTPPDLAPGAPQPLLNDRPPLVLTAAVHGPVATPFPITVIVNHLRSLSGIDGTDGPRIRAKRRAQAEFLAALIQQHQATERVVSIGDYNAFPFNDGFVDVVGTIKGTPTPADQVALASSDVVDPDLTNLGDSLGAAQQYSFVFDGNAQALDHIIVNSLALNRFTRAGYARSNSDFPESLRGDATRPERVSDHDAAIAYFAFPSAPIVTLAGNAPLNVEAYTSFTDPGASAHDDEGPLAVTTSGDVDVNTPGDYTLTYSATNGYLTTTITRLVRVRDTIPPQILGYSLSPNLLSPANHRLVTVAATYSADDASGPPACTLSVESSEPVNGADDGNTDSDWIVVDANHVRLRAERSGKGNGRIYTVTVSCADASNNIERKTERVSVPK
jgi:uncharacterized protein